MKAIVQSDFGAPADVLKLTEIDRPEYANDEVLVRIHAASIHIGDSHMTKGVPYALRPVFAMARSKDRIPGSDIAGTVEAVGPDVTTLVPGDEVFGWGKGAFAEYVSTPQRTLAPKPTNLTLEEASAVGTSAFTALQALRDHGKLEAGQHVLITGASGGVGTSAVQIAKALGAEVTGVCSARNADMVRSLGADHLIDYAQEDYTAGSQRYDLILDNIGAHSLADARRALVPDGLLLANGAPVSGWFGGLGYFVSAFFASTVKRQQGRPFVAVANETDLAALRDLVEEGKLVPVIDRTYELSQTAEAMAYVGQGHSQGKTVVTINPASDNERIE